MLNEVYIMENENVNEKIEEPKKFDVCNYISKVDVFRDKMEKFKPDFLIDQILPSNTVDMLAAEPKAKKSFLAISMAGAIASGRPWLDEFATKQVPVLYLNLEVAPAYFMEMINKTLGYDYSGDLYIAHNNFMNPFRFMISTNKVSRNTGDEWVSGIRSNQLNKKAINGLLQFKEDVPNLGLLIIDSFRRSTTASENSSDEVSSYFDAINSIKAYYGNLTVLIIHHSTKESSKSSRESNPMKAVRGSSDILASVDNLYMLTPQRKSSAPGRELLTLRTDYGRIKLKRGLGYAEGIDISVYDYKENDGKERLGFHLEGAAYEGASKTEKAKNKILELLELADGPIAYNTLIASTKGSAGVSEGTCKTALNNLIEVGRIMKNKEGSYEVVKEG